MPRRKKTSPAEDMIELVALLPWYVGVGSAIVTYLLLHRLAVAPLSVVIQPGEISGALTGAVGKGLAGIGQYVLPLLCLVGAGVSAWRRRARSVLIDKVTHAEAPEMLNNMTWREFEMLVGEAFRLQGYDVVENSVPGPDEGIDLILRKNGETHLVQCKQWRAFKVGVAVVRELYGVMAAKGASSGFVVTSGRFTGEAEAFAVGRNVRLLDGPKLHRMLKAVKDGTAAARDAPKPLKHSWDSVPPNPSTVALSCPKCSGQMTRRTASKGRSAGKDFWGCASFPKCTGTRAL